MNLSFKNKIRKINSIWKFNRSWIETERQWQEEKGIRTFFSEKKIQNFFEECAPVTQGFVDILIKHNYHISVHSYYCGIKIYQASKNFYNEQLSFLFFIHPEMTETPYMEIIKSPLEIHSNTDKTPLESILEENTDKIPPPFWKGKRIDIP